MFFSRIFNAQGYYAWADAWTRYGKNPEGPYPECTHSDLKEMFRLKDSQGNLTSEYYENAYQKLLNSGSKQTNADADHYIKDPAPMGCGLKMFKDEMTNAELGTILSPQGHPEQLIAKIKKSKQDYPSFYKKDMGY